MKEVFVEYLIQCCYDAESVLTVSNGPVQVHGNTDMNTVRKVLFCVKCREHSDGVISGSCLDTIVRNLNFVSVWGRYFLTLYRVCSFTRWPNFSLVLQSADLITRE